ncbi:MAG: glycoside hydrolase family 95 protein [Cyclobacteriaceae bacterium]
MKWKLEIKAVLFLLYLLASSFSNPPEKKEVLWYGQPAQKWAEAFPIGNGRLAAMTFGGVETERFQINEESLWAGEPANPYAENFLGHLETIQEMVLSGDYASAQDFGIEKLTARPTSFRSYQPFADLTLEFGEQEGITQYRRELDLSNGLSRVSYRIGDSEIVRESFISAADDVLVIRLSASGKEKINCKISIEPHKDAHVTALSGGRLKMKGQIHDIEAPDAYDDNPGGSGSGGKHMRFAGALQVKNTGGTLKREQEFLWVASATEVVLIFTVATDYNLSLLGFDPSIDPQIKTAEILQKANAKSWEQLKEAHTNEHRMMFERVSLKLGVNPRDDLPLDQRLKAFQEGEEDQDLFVKMFQFGRYLLMGSSRRPAVLPANLQGKWSEEAWAPWEADYHLNVNLQMNYWPSDVTNLSETNQPLIDWLEQIVHASGPLAKEMYGSNGWFSCLASNPFGRVAPSASTLESQFLNGVLDPLAGAWMVMNLWDHFEYTQDLNFLENRLFPMLLGASEFILDVMVADKDGQLHFIPSASPENSYVDPVTGRSLRITKTSTYHLSVIKAVFDATLSASKILDLHDPILDRISAKEGLLPPFPIDKNGRLLEWREGFKEAEPGHRHLSHLLGFHPFAMITSDQPELYKAAKMALNWRKENGQANGWGWSLAHSLIMYAWFLEPENAYEDLEVLLNKRTNTFLNADDIFQIDGNFGITSGIAEMLIQSHRTDESGNYIIHLLPAIPNAWVSGSVKGLCARGNFELAMSWEGEKLQSASIFSKIGGSCVVRFGDKTLKLDLKPGEERKLQFY